LTVACAMACGEDDPRAGDDEPLPPVIQCAAFTACGGDPTGNWRITETCVVDAALREQVCAADPNGASVRIELTGYVLEGSFELEAGGSAKLTLSSKETRQSDTPFACGGEDCQALEDDLANPGAGRASAECTVNESVCHCAAEFEIPRTSASGTWSVSGSTLTVTSSGFGLPFEFCREGEVLYLRDPIRGLRLVRR
jgi:hypothetical protein